MPRFQVRRSVLLAACLLPLCPAGFLTVRGQAGSARADSGRVQLETGMARIRAGRIDHDKAAETLGGLWRPGDSVEWDFRVERAGWYQMIVHYALPSAPMAGDSGWKAMVGDQTRLGPIHATGSAERFLPQVLFDPIELKAGKHVLSLSIRSDSAMADLKIRKVELVRAREPGRPD